MAKVDIDDPVITFVINRDNGEMVYRWVTDEKLPEKINLKRNQHFSFNIEIENIFPNGVFSVQLGVKKRDRSAEYVLVNEADVFEVINRGRYPGDIRWKPRERFEVL
jgi:ABC-2 type transport system ATP-binding protein